MPKLEREIIKRRFSNAASTYNSHARIHRSIAHYLIAHTIFPPTKKMILEIASGTGILSSMLDPWYPQEQVLCIDISIEMLLKNREKRQSGVYIQADFESLPFTTPFPLILSSTALQWVEHSDHIGEILSNNLDKDGTFAVAIVLDGTFSLLHKIKNQVLNSQGIYPENERSHALPSFDAVKKSITQTGLELKRAERHTFIDSFKNSSEVFDSIRGLGISGAPKNPLTKEQFLILKNEYQKACQEQSQKPYLEYQIGFFWGKNK